MTTFLFDVDGTLTDARKPINEDFKQFMFEFLKTHKCMIVTGSDRPKTIEQVGEDLTNMFERVYHCSGNHVFVGSEEVSRNEWELSNEHIKFLEEQLQRSNYPEKVGQHIEQRIGTANFSICGRAADWEQRDRYKEWEQVNRSREIIAIGFNEMFDDAIAQVAGETSIDIFPNGCDKSQAVLQQNDTTIFFGDNCMPGGNDYSAAQISTVFHQIDRGYKQTWEILKNRYF